MLLPEVGVGSQPLNLLLVLSTSPPGVFALRPIAQPTSESASPEERSKNLNPGKVES